MGEGTVGSALAHASSAYTTGGPTIGFYGNILSGYGFSGGIDSDGAANGGCARIRGGDAASKAAASAASNASSNATSAALKGLAVQASEAHLSAIMPPREPKPVHASFAEGLSVGRTPHAARCELCSLPV